MSQTLSEGLVAVTGNIYSFGTDETIAYGANAPVPTEAIDHGFTNEDGVSVTTDKSTTNILTWQGSQIMRVLTTESSVTFSFTLYQSNDANAELYYGRIKNATTGAYHVDSGLMPAHRSFIIDAIDTTNAQKIRYYLADAQVTAVGDQTINAQGILSYEVTLTAYKTVIEGESANHLVWYDAYVPEVTTP